MSFRSRVLGFVLAGAMVAPPIVQSTASADAGAVPPERRDVLYVLHLFSNDIVTFALDPAGRPTPIGARVPTGDRPRGFVFTPDGRRVYTANGGDSTISAYTVDERGGLSPLGEPTPVGGQLPFGIAIAPSGKTLYTANIVSGTVSALAIGADGTPRLIGAPVSTGAVEPRTVSVSPDGRFVFVSHGRPAEGRRDVLVVFAVQPGGGLVRIGTPVPVGSGGNGSDLTPDGRFLYVASTGSDAVYGFGVGRDGSLSSVPGSPFPTADFPEDVAVTPDGRHLYVSSPNHDNSVTRNVTGFAIGRDGALRAVPGSPFESGEGTVGITPSQDGRRLYVSNFESHDLTGYDIGEAGALRRIAGSPFPTGGSNPTFQGTVVPPDQGPVAAFTAGGKGRAVRFDGSASSDPDGRVARYDWDFGDGTVRPDGGPRLTHVYRRPGTYRVTLTVTDDEGCATTMVFTGQSPLCNGTSAARTTRAVTVE